MNRKFLISVIGKRGIGKSTLIYNALKMKPLDGDNHENMKIIENEKAIPNICFLDIKGYEYDNHDNYIDKIISEMNNFISNKFNSNRPENYIDCIWFCIAGTKFERYELKFIELLRNKLSEIPLILIYTRAYSTNIVKLVSEYFKKYFIDIDITPVIGAECKLINGDIIKPHGIDILLEKTITKCKKKKKKNLK